MNTEQIIDELYEILDNSWQLPLSGGKIILDSKEMRCLLEDLRLNLPKEVMQAKNIVEDRNKIIDDAKAEAESIRKVSEEKIRALVNQNEIVKNAQIVASKIVSDAKNSSKEIKIAANQYAEGIMSDIDQVLVSGLNEIRKAKKALHCSDSE